MILKSKAVKFSVTFLTLFLVFYYFNIGFFSITSPQSANYNACIAQNFNYIRLLRNILLVSTSFLLKCLGFGTIFNEFELRVAGHGGIRLIYSCLGLGVMSFFTSFVLAYPKAFRQKIFFLISGLVTIQLLNIVRMAIVALFWTRKAQLTIDHHIVFNTIIYVIIGIGLYFWVTTEERKKHAKN